MIEAGVTHLLQMLLNGHLEKYKFSWEWLRDFSGFRLFRFAIWQLIEVPLIWRYLSAELNDVLDLFAAWLSAGEILVA